MNKKHYNNVIDWTLKHDQTAQTEDSLATARAIFKNMGVALPNGSMQEVYDTIKTNQYMGWRACTMEEAQKAADKGTAAIGISKDRVVILSATDEEEPVTATASVMTLSENTSAYAVADLAYYSYGCGSQTSLYFANSYLSVNVGWTGYNQPLGNTLSTIYWTSSNSSVASVDYHSGYITTQKAGIATITARCGLDSCSFATFEIWVRGKTPVFLIHGRTSNSFSTWGAGNRIFTDPLNPVDRANNHFNSSVNALSVGNVQALYTNKSVQDILGYNSGLPMTVDGEVVQNFFVPGVFNGEFKDGEYSTEHPEGGNLAYYLKDNGYKENINLFVFNYPNADAVVHSAKKFEAYINNLITYVRNSGTDEMKTCFYNSRVDYAINNYTINLVGHSMGGLVSRYYIENLGHDAHVDKLITICTPHWGSGYAQLSNDSSINHVLSDHDLDFDSAMFGGNHSTNLSDGCSLVEITDLWTNCTDSAYALTDELKYSKSRHTKYYAIAGIDYNAATLDSNDTPIDLPTNFTTYQQIIDYMTEKSVYKSNMFTEVIPMDVLSVGDNMVGFMSQIGWTEDKNAASPSKRISMEKIFVDVDTNGGNGGERFVWEVLWNAGKNLLHSKINHRKCVCDKVIEYLGELL